MRVLSTLYVPQHEILLVNSSIHIYPGGVIFKFLVAHSQNQSDVKNY